LMIWNFCAGQGEEGASIRVCTLSQHACVSYAPAV
jgi:hypothetical protein